ncbi:solute symporter family [Acididesulfobacillus acetoxydans]|uniref:Na+/solute symporter n=1 Tax=Acididesulfobacillus acetoxydans TaxID=1561005 RepID=A0A8S0XBE2_9FIRM|nr:sodium:solute symporter family protein [Acididesulfobacillus acetoxydans]CAA7601126.1 solute symporter family [Acididesulfobacillus acetoxydans]CEJ08595.1 Na+/solute symporter [Acididesulfobacillus acetoxydans]
MKISVFVVILVLYLGIIAFLSYLGYKKTRSSKDYMVAGGEVHPYLMGLAYGASFISTSAIVGFGGAAGVYGMSLLWLTFANIFVGVFIAFVVFGKPTRALGHQLEAYTFPELLGKRYDSVFLRRYAAALFSILMPLYAAAVLTGGARFLQESMHLSFSGAVWIFAVLVMAFVYFGGLRGVVYTDAFRGTLDFLVMATLIVLTYVKLGGISHAHAQLEAMKNMVPPALAAQGHTGWASMPVFGSQIWWFVVSTLILGVGIGVLAQPQLIVRYLMVKSSREINQALIFGGVFILFMTGVAFTVGALSNVYFKDTTGKIAIAAAGGNSDLIIPSFVSQAMPSWLSYLFLLGLLAAAMSALSGQFHMISTSVSYDLNPKADKNANKTVMLGRLGIVVGFILTMFVVFQLPGSIIPIATSIFFGLCASAFLPMYVGALYWSRSSRAGAIGSMLAGTLIYLCMVLFIHSKEASIFGVSKALFGKSPLFATPLNYIDPLVVALPVSIVIFAVVSLLTKAGDIPLPRKKTLTV